ncbi:MAG: 16S rRNA (cytosine(967)-C(5))-methyltransferase RsmB [Thermodesulfobacteriota bacterium]
MPTPVNARAVALRILTLLDSDQRTLDAVLDETLSGEPHLQKRDIGLMHTLVFGVLRWRNRLDWIINHFSKTPLKKIHPDVLNILRIGLFQILYLDRIPDSAAVNTAVELAKTSSAKWTHRFVNGLLRSAVRKSESVPYPSPENDPALALAVTQSFPQWLMQRWIDRFGFEETRQLCEAVNTIPSIGMRVNTLKIERDHLLETLRPGVHSIAPARYSPVGLTLSNPESAIPDLPGFQEGWFQVQDEAAQLVGYFLDPQPGDHVLDACAGLGGKTGHIAQMMNNQGRILALDNSSAKLKRLRIEMARIGATIVSTRTHDLNTPPKPEEFGTFDRILLDAPCSGLGVLRRNPDTKWRVSPSDFERYQARQIEFLENLAPLLKPSGVFVYAVCSSEPEENEQVITSFLISHPSFFIEKEKSRFPPFLRSLMSDEGILKTSPHKNDMDGFFSVCLKRKI